MNCHSSVLGQVWGGTWNYPLRPYLLGSTVFPTTRCLFLPLLPPFQNAITFHFDRFYHIPHIPHDARRHWSPLGVRLGLRFHGPYGPSSPTRGSSCIPGPLVGCGPDML
jgi:hypothetical protein